MKKIGRIVVEEVRKALPAWLFFLALFHLIALTRAVLLNANSMGEYRAVGATVGALVVAKAVLIVDALAVARRFSGRLIVQVLWKTFLYNIVVLVFRAVEDMIPLVSEHGGLVPAARAMYNETSWPVFVVIELWVVAGLLLYCLASELIREVGADRIKEIFFGSRRGRAS